MHPGKQVYPCNKYPLTHDVHYEINDPEQLRQALLQSLHI
jgi:hypothetical protein